MARKVSDGVGKKIVEALKKQSEIEINPIPASQDEDNLDILNEISEGFDTEDASVEELLMEDELISEENVDDEAIPSFESEETFEVHETFAQPTQPSFAGYQQPMAPAQETFISELDNFEIPSNIAVLKKLISQLPSGVTRHTGAQIIKQTMEALGISMKSVLQEAQQVQEGLNNSAKECYNTIQDYKKQIQVLEKQAQNHQRQYSALNELISLFVQTGV